ncbi:MAG TPA: 3-deoxy-7-phosphoheptulonate synthase [Phycisphaerae bacterium]|nr:3-deoxy-7-phosphoheptulonate synthase [Phycisphaerae bacterium]
MDMIAILKTNVSDEDVQRVVERIAELGLDPHVSQTEYRTVISTSGGGGSPQVREQIEQLAGVDQVTSIAEPYRLASRAFHEADTILDIKGIRVGGPHVNVIAGPCAIEGRELLFEVGAAVKEAGASILRGGAFKPRSSPYSFQGKGQEGLELLKEAGEQLNMPTITEVTDPRDVEIVYQYADIFQIGARNMQNFNLLLEVGKTDKPVFIKRGLAASITELLMSAEYVLSQGNHRVMLCERGIRTFADEVRFTLDVSAVPVIQQRCHLPVFVDPSHAAGKRDLVGPLALAAVAAGAAGVIVEVHTCPDKALCDGPQALLPAKFQAMMEQLRSIAEVVGHRVTRWGEDSDQPRPRNNSGWMS